MKGLRVSKTPNKSSENAAKCEHFYETVHRIVPKLIMSPELKMMEVQRIQCSILPLNQPTGISCLIHVSDCLYLIKYHAIKTYGGGAVIAPRILNFGTGRT